MFVRNVKFDSFLSTKRPFPVCYGKTHDCRRGDGTILPTWMSHYTQTIWTQVRMPHKWDDKHILKTFLERNTSTPDKLHAISSPNTKLCLRSCLLLRNFSQVLSLQAHWMTIPLPDKIPWTMRKTVPVFVSIIIHLPRTNKQSSDLSLNTQGMSNRGTSTCFSTVKLARRPSLFSTASNSHSANLEPEFACCEWPHKADLLFEAGYRDARHDGGSGACDVSWSWV